MPGKVPPAATAWALLASLDDQDETQPDVARPDYVGPVPIVVLVAALKHLHQRVKALETAAANR